MPVSNQFHNFYSDAENLMDEDMLMDGDNDEMLENEHLDEEVEIIPQQIK